MQFIGPNSTFEIPVRGAVHHPLTPRPITGYDKGAKRRGRWDIVVRSQKQEKGKTSSKGAPLLDSYRPPGEEEASLRAEAEAPFRSLRIVLFGFGAVSAGLATLFSIPPLIASIAGAPQAKALFDIGQDFGINIAALGVCGLLLKQDLDARSKQLARLMREDALGACQLELTSGKVLRLAQLRGAARPVLIAGTPSQVAAGLKAAEPYRKALMERGVFVVPLPLYPETKEDGIAVQGQDALFEYNQSNGPQVPPSENLRWRGNPIRINEWRKWFDDQAAAASKETSGGLYVGLRMDGRVRASGVGCPPWAKFALQLPPIDGMWGGFLDGMDGRVG